jgi:hypothetical protein
MVDPCTNHDHLTSDPEAEPIGRREILKPMSSEPLPAISSNFFTYRQPT